MAISKLRNRGGYERDNSGPMYSPRPSQPPPQMAPPMQSEPPAAAPAPGPQPAPQGRALPRPIRRPAPQPPQRRPQPGRGLPRPVSGQFDPSRPLAGQFDPNSIQNGLGQNGGSGPGSWTPGGARQEQLLYNDLRGRNIARQDFIGDGQEWQSPGPMPMQRQNQGTGSDSQQFRDAMTARNSRDWGPMDFQVQGGPSSQFRGPQAGLQGAPSRNFNQQFPQGRGGDDMVSTMPVRPRRPAPKVPPRKNMPGVVGAPPRRSGSVY